MVETPSSGAEFLTGEEMSVGLRVRFDQDMRGTILAIDKVQVVIKWDGVSGAIAYKWNSPDSSLIYELKREEEEQE